MHDLLRETDIFNYSHPSVAGFLSKALAAARPTDQDRSLALYYAVRDGIDYEVFETDIGEPGLQASSVVESGRGFCLHKSILYVAVCRAAGIPARLRASLVENHLSTPKLEQLVGGTTFLHWFTEIQLNGGWVKLTPVFGKLLCRVYGIEPLEFDASHDSIDQQSNHGGHMRFLAEPQVADSPTYSSLIDLVRHHHPLMVDGSGTVPAAPAAVLETHSDRTHHADQIH